MVVFLLVVPLTPLGESLVAIAPSATSLTFAGPIRNIRADSTNKLQSKGPFLESGKNHCFNQKVKAQRFNQTELGKPKIRYQIAIKKEVP